MSKRKARGQLKLKPAEIEQISAYLDGELSAQESAATAERIRRDAAWGRAARSFEVVDSMMEAWQAPPLRRDLTGSILAKAHRRPERPTWLRVAAPLAAAAAILVVVVLYQVAAPPARRAGGPTAAAPAQLARLAEETVLAAVPEEDRFVVENLDVIENLDVLANFDTLQAMDRLSRSGDI